MDKHFFIDLDDTLVETVYLYSLAIFELGSYVYGRFGNEIPYLEHLNLVQLQKKIDVKLFEEMGVDRRRFPTSFLLTYRKICKEFELELKKEDEQKVWELGEIPFDMNYYEKKGLIAGVPETLDFLIAQNDSIHLVTLGDLSVQQDKIDTLELKKYFGKNITIEPKKDKKLYERLTKGLDKKKCYMVGNSLRGDINPALEAGLNAIYVRSIGSEWSYEDGSKRPEVDFFEFKKFSDIKKNYEQL